MSLVTDYVVTCCAPKPCCELFTATCISGMVLLVHSVVRFAGSDQSAAQLLRN